MPTKPLEIRTMRPHELETVLDWAAAEGWNPGLGDAECFHASDPGGFLLGEVDGEPVASIFAVKYGAGFAFIGGYIVPPAWRGRGYGKRLWDAAMARLAGRNVGLDGVVAQQANYARSGFELAHRNVRYEGRGYGRPVAGNGVIALAALPFEQVRSYDRAFFPDERVRFLQCWIGQARGIAVGVRGPHGLAGYAVSRPCRNGYKIGPLFADTAALADTLLCNLLGRVGPEVPVFLDVPESNPAAVALAGGHGMRVCFETARMYTGPRPELSMARLYGITTFELG